MRRTIDRCHLTPRPPYLRGPFLADLVGQAGRGRRAGPAPPGPALSAQEPRTRQTGDGRADARCWMEKRNPAYEGRGSDLTGRECRSTHGKGECSRSGQIIFLRGILSVLPPTGVKDRDPALRGPHQFPPGFAPQAARGVEHGLRHIIEGNHQRARRIVEEYRL